LKSADTGEKMAIDISKRIYSSEAQQKKEGSEVVLAGWAADVKNMGKIAFIKLRDREGIVQLTAFPDFAMFGEIEKIPKESVIAVRGKVKESKLKSGAKEVLLEEIEVLSKSEPVLPIDFSGKIPTGLDKRLDNRPIDLRNLKHLDVFKIQSKLVEGAVEWLSKNSFSIVFTPCLMGTPSESGAEMFTVPYFKKKAYLRQDPQLHRQLTIIAGLDKIADIGPSWRAELSYTTRHLCEHRGIAVELAWIRDEYDVMRVEEQLFVAMLMKVKNECKNELERLGVAVEIPKTPFPEIRFPEAYEILERAGKKDRKIDPDAERILADYAKKKYNSEIFFLNKFPFAEKPFYVMQDDDEPEYARSTDMIYRGLELSSGGQREHRYERLIENVKAKQMNLKSVEWFTKFFAFGVPPHGGFGIGVERLTMQLLGLANVREAVLFPRDPDRLTP